MSILSASLSVVCARPRHVLAASAPPRRDAPAACCMTMAPVAVGSGSAGHSGIDDPARPVSAHGVLLHLQRDRRWPALLTVTSRNPIYSALWFASVVLSTTGLFLLANAPFLAAGTIIVYAGAIIVTFLFVIMLAQMEGKAVYDRAARAPGAATCHLLLALVVPDLFAVGAHDRSAPRGFRAGPASRTRDCPRPTRWRPLQRVARGSGSGLPVDFLARTTPRATRSKMSPAWAKHFTRITWSPLGSPASCCSSR